MKTAVLLLLCGMLCGCHGNRAYNDLYVENMAAEIRHLEDQLYEYDHEYHLLEQELSFLKAENARMRKTQAKSSSSSSPKFAPTRSTPKGFGGSSTSGSLPDPDSIIDSGRPPASRNSAPSLPAESASPSNAAPSVSPPNLSPGTPPADSTDVPEFDLDVDDLVPPSIEPGEPMPPPRPVGGQSTSNTRGPENALELNLSRIEVPAQLASQKSSSLSGEADGELQLDASPGNTNANAADSFTATITPAVEEVSDLRVIELAFHPTLSRAANFDDRTDDDGLYLVIQPLNEAGQVVPIAADLSVVILDPSRSGPEARIGRRDFSANEVKAKLQAGGKAQGIHLTLPWNGPDPQADRVIVFARYTFPDGRRVIGDKTFFVSGEDGLKTVWAPRGNTRDSAVVTAGHAEPQSAQQASSGTNVVRPAVGSSMQHPAPTPGFGPR